jgi:hypothetical protein
VAGSVSVLTVLEQIFFTIQAIFLAVQPDSQNPWAQFCPSDQRAIWPRLVSLDLNRGRDLGHRVVQVPRQMRR